MKKRHSPKQIVRTLRQADEKLASSASVPESSSFHRWRNRYGRMYPGERKRLKELEKENACPKKFVADQALDIQILKEASRKTSEPSLQTRGD